MLPMEAGMVPVSPAFFDKSSAVMAVNVDTVTGIVPDKPLADRASDSTALLLLLQVTPYHWQG